MNTGDLVRKVDGYGKEMGWLGIVVGQYTHKTTGLLKVIVLTEGSIDHWIKIYVERVQ